MIIFVDLFGKTIKYQRMTTNQAENQPEKINELHRAFNGRQTVYYSKQDDNGETIYSFSRDFVDCWTQAEEDATH